MKPLSQYLISTLRCKDPQTILISKGKGKCGPREDFAAVKSQEALPCRVAHLWIPPAFVVTLVEPKICKNSPLPT